MITVSTTVGTYAGGNVIAVFDVPENVKYTLQYLDSASKEWKDMTYFFGNDQTGFPLMDATSYFKVVFQTPGVFDVTVRMVTIESFIAVENGSAEDYVDVCFTPATQFIVLQGQDDSGEIGISDNLRLEGFQTGSGVQIQIDALDGDAVPNGTVYVTYFYVAEDTIGGQTIEYYDTKTVSANVDNTGMDPALNVDVSIGFESSAFRAYATFVVNEDEENEIVYNVPYFDIEVITLG